jgi:hypothetical protein
MTMSHDGIDDALRVVVLGGQRVPVGDEEQAGILVLQPTQFFSTPW